MKNLLLFLLKLIGFWLLLFALQHTFFLIYNHGELKPTTFTEILSSYYYAFAMDLSATAFLISIPTLLLLTSFIFKTKKWIVKSIHMVNYSLIVICLFITCVDTSLYSMWGSKINSKALSYALYPGEMMQAAKAVPYWLFILVFMVEGAVLFYLYKRYMKIDLSGKIHWGFKIILAPLLLFLLVIAMRGGFQKFPLSKSWVYYSKYPVLNNAALNGFWNFMEIIVIADDTVNPYRYFAQDKAQRMVDAMQCTPRDSTAYILTVARPNIVLILMESVSAECMTTLGGEAGIMPHLDSLTKQSLLFTKFYANGFRTEQGLISLLCGFPAQPKTTILRKFGKFDKLTNMPKILGNNGYSENYYYSGDIQFANTEAFLNLSGFTKIMNETNYPWKKTTDWGAYDEELFACQVAEAARDSQPFFSIIMTSTNHEPFDATVEKVFGGNADADKYKNTVHYTDKCIADYLHQAATQPWFHNTLFIITSDHAHSFPNARAANDAERHHVPLLFYGKVLKPEYCGQVDTLIGSQIDFPAMLLGQLKLPHQEFVKSKNLFNVHTPQFAYYTFDNGFGIITPQQTLVFDHDLNQVVYRKTKMSAAADAMLLDNGKAYLQVLFEEYLRFNY